VLASLGLGALPRLERHFGVEKLASLRLAQVNPGSHGFQGKSADWRFYLEGPSFKVFAETGDLP
jgi:hypothetical protein